MASGSPARHKAYLNTAPRPKRRFRPEPFPFSLQRTAFAGRRFRDPSAPKPISITPYIQSETHAAWHAPERPRPDADDQRSSSPLRLDRMRRAAPSTWSNSLFFIKPMITASLRGRLTGRQFKTGRKRELDSMKSSSGCEPKSVLLSAAHHWMPIPRLTSLVVLNEPSLTFSSETFQVPCSREERLAAVTAVQTRSRYCVMQPSPI